MLKLFFNEMLKFAKIIIVWKIFSKINTHKTIIVSKILLWLFNKNTEDEYDAIQLILVKLNLTKICSHKRPMWLRPFSPTELGRLFCLYKPKQKPTFLFIF